MLFSARTARGRHEMPTHPTRVTGLLLLAGLCLVLPAGAADTGYPPDLDPRFDLPSPPAWADTPGFPAAAQWLLEQTRGPAPLRVRVDLRVPAVDPARLDAAQADLWAADLQEIQQAVLDLLPEGSYEQLAPRPDAAAVLPDPVVTPAATRLLLLVDRVALETLMDTDLVARVQASLPPERHAAGAGHSLMIAADGVLWSWGLNTAGQLGDGTLSSRALPAPVLAATSAVAAGYNHSLALQEDGTLWAWGSNSAGQLGDGTATRRVKPVTVLTGVTAMAAGGAHTLALTADGVLWAWGDNSAGQVGDGTLTRRLQPRPILTDVTHLAAGDRHNLALKADGSLWAWGANNAGQLGDGTTYKALRPLQILTGVTGLAAGGYHSLALKADGSLWAWGANDAGQLGDSTIVPRLRPKKVLSDIRAVAAGAHHSLALKTDDSLWVWGYNAAGQLGDNSTTRRLRPKKLLSDVGAVAAGAEHSLVRKTNGSLWAWGANGSGQLGDGAWTKAQLLPVRVRTNTIAVSATDPLATEAGTTTGTYTFTRTGDTSAPLTITYGVSGSATVGSDFTTVLGRSITFAAGKSQATRHVKPLQDVLAEGEETVVLTLTDGAGYRLGTPHQATVTIMDDDR